MEDEVRDPLPNPFESRQQPGKDKTLKWCAWDVLKRLKNATDTKIADEIMARGLRSNAKSASVSKQCTEELKHFVRVGAQWTLRLLAGAAELAGDGAGQQLAAPAAAAVDAVADNPPTEPQSTVSATAQVGGKPRKRPARTREVSIDEVEILPPRQSKPAVEWWLLPGAPTTSEPPSKRSKEQERPSLGGDAGGVDGVEDVRIDEAQERQEQQQEPDSQGEEESGHDEEAQQEQQHAVVARGVAKGEVEAEKPQAVGGGAEAHAAPEDGHAHAAAQVYPGMGAPREGPPALVGPGVRQEGEQQPEGSNKPAPLDVGQSDVAATQGCGSVALGENSAVPDATTSGGELPVEEKGVQQQQMEAEEVLPASLFPFPLPMPQQQQEGVAKVEPTPEGLDPAAAHAAAAAVPAAAPLVASKQKAGPPAGQPVAASFVIPKRQPGGEAPDKQPPAKSSPPPFRIPKATDPPAARASPPPLHIPRTTEAAAVKQHKEKEGGAHQGRRDSAVHQAPTRPPAHEHRRPDPPPPRPEALPPWKLMMQQNNSALARHWDTKWEFKHAIVAPKPVDPASVSARQHREWAEVARRHESVPKTFKEAVPTNPYPRLPAHISHVRVMHCSNSTHHVCMERGVFASNHQADIEGMHPLTTLVLMHNFDKKRVYGCYLAKQVGMNLDTSFGPEWPYQVRVEPIKPFDPLPSEMLEPFIPRRVNPRDGKPMKFFEKGCSGAQNVWHLFQFFHEKL